MSAPVLRGAAILAVVLGCWAVWVFGGALLAWAGLDDLDLPARVVLVFAFLSVCQAVLQRFPGVLHRINQAQDPPS